ncbi:unnamed protein product [Amoebophrya sp. A120]|nr:unnamed protein product [Amoebophrya sp. A120]|eukprot:GSA120T00015264001.1
MRGATEQSLHIHVTDGHLFVERRERALRDGAEDEPKSAFLQICRRSCRMEVLHETPLGLQRNTTKHPPRSCLALFGILSLEKRMHYLLYCSKATEVLDLYPEGAYPFFSGAGTTSKKQREHVDDRPSSRPFSFFPGSSATSDHWAAPDHAGGCNRSPSYGKIFRVAQVELLPINSAQNSTSTVHAQKIQGLERLLQSSGFYFSNEIDLTRTLQRKLAMYNNSSATTAPGALRSTPSSTRSHLRDGCGAPVSVSSSLSAANTEVKMQSGTGTGTADAANQRGPCVVGPAARQQEPPAKPISVGPGGIPRAASGRLSASYENTQHFLFETADVRFVWNHEMARIFLHQDTRTQAWLSVLMQGFVGERAIDDVSFLSPADYNRATHERAERMSSRTGRAVAKGENSGNVVPQDAGTHRVYAKGNRPSQPNLGTNQDVTLPQGLQSPTSGLVREPTTFFPASCGKATSAATDCTGSTAREEKNVKATNGHRGCEMATSGSASDPASGCSGRPVPSSASVRLLLIVRRSCRRVGTRYACRGMDDAGDVANFCELEQLAQLTRTAASLSIAASTTPSATTAGAATLFTQYSFIQIRGSVPLFWEQNAMGIPELTREHPQFAKEGFRKHQEGLERMYGCVMYVNLLSDKKAGEQMLVDSLQEQVQEYLREVRHRDSRAVASKLPRLSTKGLKNNCGAVAASVSVSSSAGAVVPSPACSNISGVVPGGEDSLNTAVGTTTPSSTTTAPKDAELLRTSDAVSVAVHSDAQGPAGTDRGVPPRGSDVTVTPPRTTAAQDSGRAAELRLHAVDGVSATTRGHDKTTTHCTGKTGGVAPLRMEQLGSSSPSSGGSPSSSARANGPDDYGAISGAAAGARRCLLLKHFDFNHKGLTSVEELFAEVDKWRPELEEYGFASCDGLPEHQVAVLTHQTTFDRSAGESGRRGAQDVVHGRTSDHEAHEPGDACGSAGESPVQPHPCVWRTRQSGVVRTNCMDCLDRTNLMQFGFCWWFVQQVFLAEEKRRAAGKSPSSAASPTNKIKGGHALSRPDALTSVGPIEIVAQPHHASSSQTPRSPKCSAAAPSRSVGKANTRQSIHDFIAGIEPKQVKNDDGSCPNGAEQSASASRAAVGAAVPTRLFGGPVPTLPTSKSTSQQLEKQMPEADAPGWGQSFFDYFSTSSHAAEKESGGTGEGYNGAGGEASFRDPQRHSHDAMRSSAEATVGIGTGLLVPGDEQRVRGGLQVLWADAGDQVSEQTTGVASIYSTFLREGKHSHYEFAWRSVARKYNALVEDATRQECLDALLRSPPLSERFQNIVSREHRKKLHVGNFTLFTCTWNVGGTTDPLQELTRVLPEVPRDIMVFNFQEVVDLGVATATSLVGGSWDTTIEQEINAKIDAALKQKYGCGHVASPRRPFCPRFDPAKDPPAAATNPDLGVEGRNGLGEPRSYDLSLPPRASGRPESTAEASRSGVHLPNPPTKQPAGASLNLRGGTSTTSEKLFSHVSYSKVKGCGMIGQYSVVFVADHLAPMISRIGSCDIPEGMGGMAGNKGAVVLNFQLLDTTLCFANVHLESGITNASRRYAQLTNILQSGRIWNSDKSRFNYDIVICAGDFNFRLLKTRIDTSSSGCGASPAPKAGVVGPAGRGSGSSAVAGPSTGSAGGVKFEQLSDVYDPTAFTDAELDPFRATARHSDHVYKHWRDLCRFDQYLNEKASMLSLQEHTGELGKTPGVDVATRMNKNYLALREMPIAFPPTYRLHREEYHYDVSRQPAWCDRILFAGRGLKVPAHRHLHEDGADVVLRRRPLNQQGTGALPLSSFSSLVPSQSAEALSPSVATRFATGDDIKVLPLKRAQSLGANVGCNDQPQSTSTSGETDSSDVESCAATSSSSRTSVVPGGGGGHSHHLTGQHDSHAAALARHEVASSGAYLSSRHAEKAFLGYTAYFNCTGSDHRPVVLDYLEGVLLEFHDREEHGELSGLQEWEQVQQAGASLMSSPRVTDFGKGSGAAAATRKGDDRAVSSTRVFLPVVERQGGRETREETANGSAALPSTTLSIFTSDEQECRQPKSQLGSEDATQCSSCPEGQKPPRQGAGAAHAQTGAGNPSSQPLQPVLDVGRPTDALQRTPPLFPQGDSVPASPHSPRDWEMLGQVSPHHSTGGSEDAEAEFELIENEV